MIETGLVGMLSTASHWTTFWAAWLGFFNGTSLVFGLALPALLSASADIARLSAGMFTISYSFAMGLRLRPVRHGTLVETRASRSCQLLSAPCPSRSWRLQFHFAPPAFPSVVFVQQDSSIRECGLAATVRWSIERSTLLPERLGRHTWLSNH
jgi:hypothetical protein